jgi:hypothetical protein
MLRIGDIVTPKEPYIGYGYMFKIVDYADCSDMNPFEDNKYLIKRVCQKLDPIRGPFDKQIRKMDYAEMVHWLENDLELLEITNQVGPTPDFPISIQNQKIEKITFSKEILGETYINIDANKIQIKNKEEIDMKNILDIYKERKIKLIENKYKKLKEEIEENDEIQKIMEETIRLIQDTDPNRKFPQVFYNSFTTETLEKEKEIDNEYKEEINALNYLIEEVEALFLLTSDYTERIKILKDYEILNKKGKLNI